MCGVSLHYLIFPFINQRANCAQSNLIFDRSAELTNAIGCRVNTKIPAIIYSMTHIYGLCLNNLKKKNRHKMKKITLIDKHDRYGL